MKTWFLEDLRWQWAGKSLQPLQSRPFPMCSLLLDSSLGKAGIYDRPCKTLWDLLSTSLLQSNCFIIIIINPLIARVVGAPQMILQPVFSIFPVLHCPLGLGELQSCSFSDVVFPPLPLSALSSYPFHCALQDGSGQTWWTGDMTIPLQFVSIYGGQEVFVWSDCLLDLGTDFLVGNINMVFVWDA